MEVIERKVLWQSLTGSHNYNLATEDSDRDYKVFTAPTFEDLYNNYKYKRNIVTDEVDMDVKDIRQLPNLLWKSNIVYLELLFSKDIKHADNDKLRHLLNLRDDIVKMNLPQLFKSTGGMFNQRMKNLEKGSDGTQHLVDKHGYNTKEAMHCFRTLYVCNDFASKGFRDFEGSLRHEGDIAEFMLAIKNGMMSKELFIDFINRYHDERFVSWKEHYYNQEPNEKLREYVESLIMEVVESEIHDELYIKMH